MVEYENMIEFENKIVAQSVVPWCSDCIPKPNKQSYYLCSSIDSLISNDPITVKEELLWNEEITIGWLYATKGTARYNRYINAI